MAKDANIKTEFKISGEQEYKNACKEISRSLKLTASEIKLVTAEFGKNSTSMDVARVNSSSYMPLFS